MTNFVVKDHDGADVELKMSGAGSSGDPGALYSNVKTIQKGSVTTAHNAIDTTTTSAEIDCTGFNSIMVHATISDTYNWTFSVTGSPTTGGSFVAVYEQANTGAMAAMSYQTNASKCWVWRGIPDFIKIVATEDASGATATVKVQPMNL